MKKFNLEINENQLRILLWSLTEAKSSFLNKNELQTKLVQGLPMPRNIMNVDGVVYHIDEIINMLNTFETWPCSEEFIKVNKDLVDKNK